MTRTGMHELRETVRRARNEPERRPSPLVSRSLEGGRDPRHHRIVIIGAGFAGLGMAMRLKQRGIEDFVLLERAGEIGGTWRENTYPGCACDNMSDLYSLSFAPNSEWSHRYARQPEILEYLRGCARDFDVYPHIRFGTDVRRAAWSESESVWQVDTGRGRFSGHTLISGQGLLNTPKWPDIDGLESFRGTKFHSSRWNHDVDFSAKRVAVIGTGASAVQFVPHLQRLAGEVTVFQRTPPWILPRHDQPTSRLRRWLFRRVPLLQRMSRAIIFASTDLKHVGFSPAIGTLVERSALGHLRSQVADAALRAKLKPNYRIGCKRVLLSDDFYPALTKPNVELVDAEIRRVGNDRIVTADNHVRSFDVLIGATGFRATEPPITRIVYGRGGRLLADSWSGPLGALHGTTFAGFPNFFALSGPNSGLGHNSAVYMIEAQIDYILEALGHMERHGVRVLEPTPEAQGKYTARIQATLRDSVWLKGGCTSWYLDERGYSNLLWPGRAAEFRRTLRHFDPALYAAGPRDPTRNG